jgi:Ala-tRNA(Pro) deacylase
MIPVSITEYLDRNRARYSVMSHPVAYTAQEEAAVAHVPGSEWAKAVVCFADELPVLAVVPAPRAVDLDRLQRAMNVHNVRLARESELAPLYTDCETGAMPPLGPLYGQPVFVDRSLAGDAEIAFNGGSHRDAIRMPYREFERLVHPVVAEFATGPSERWTAELHAIDPVCGAGIDDQSVSGRSEYRGETYYFCSQRCKMEFDDNPFAYARA